MRGAPSRAEVDMLLVIDNYDSFTYNLVQCLGELGAAPLVRRNDDVTVEQIVSMAPERIVISPGPGRPEAAGISLAVIRQLGSSTPILGVCLGHQAIGAAFGAAVLAAPALVHGKSSWVEHDGLGVFRDLPARFAAGRYHSLAVAERDWPPDLVVAARAMEDGTVMGIRHSRWPVHGVQFHPESVLTADGRQILRNFLEL